MLHPPPLLHLVKVGTIVQHMSRGLGAAHVRPHVFPDTKLVQILPHHLQIDVTASNALSQRTVIMLKLKKLGSSFHIDDRI